MPVEIRVPQLGESIVEATISRWTKREGDPVSAGETLVELETDKVNVTVEAEQAGVVERIARHEGDTVAVNEVIGTIAAGAVSQASAPTVTAAETSHTAENGNGRPSVAASPVAKIIAETNGIDLATVKGTGTRGAITKEDALGAVARKQSSVASQTLPPPPPRVESPSVSAPLPPSGGDGFSGPALADLLPRRPDDERIERVRMTRRRGAIAGNLKKALNNAAMLTTFNEVDMSKVMDVRKRRRDSFKERHGVGLGFMSFFTKAVIGALKAFPLLNAEIDGDTILIKKFYDIGIAVGTEEGLVVPVVRDADRKSFAQIEKEIGELAAKARDGKLLLPELLGGTFTITNGGTYGSLMSTPILNYPQVAILGMHKIEERPMVVNGEIVIRPMMYIAMSYDHRIVDGSDAVRFVVRIKELIEDPEQLLLEA